MILIHFWWQAVWPDEAASWLMQVVLQRSFLLNTVAWQMNYCRPRSTMAEQQLVLEQPSLHFLQEHPDPGFYTRKVPFSEVSELGVGGYFNAKKSL